MIPIQLEKIEALLEPVAVSQGYEWVACEWGSEAGARVLRVFIDKAGGLEVKDCEEFSRLIDPLLEVEALISERYQLEVSSPGLNRPLKKWGDFEKFVGEKVSVKTKRPLNGRSHYKGLLKLAQNQQIQLEIDGQLYAIPFLEIMKANLEVDWDKILKNKKK